MQPTNQVETDPRFPSGPWVGFFTQDQLLPGRHWMDLNLQFADGRIEGAGRDRVGQFEVRGQYDLQDGRCHWNKQYIGAHAVFYKGYNEGQGIWGVWELTPDKNGGLHWKGGFRIWPEGMPDPTQQTLKEEVDIPIVVEEADEEVAPVGSAPNQ